MDKVTGKKPKKSTLQSIAEKVPDEVKIARYQQLWSLVELRRLAEKYMMEEVSKSILPMIACYAGEHAPFALAYACGFSPPDTEIARTALEAFRDEMPFRMFPYFEVMEYYDHSDLSYFSPAAENLSSYFAQQLGADNLLAYIKALAKTLVQVSDQEGDDGLWYPDSPPTGTRTGWDWHAVAKLFVASIKKPDSRCDCLEESDTEGTSEE